MVGTFKGTITEHILKESKKNTPSVNFKIDLTSNVTTGEAVHMTVWHDVWLTEKAFENAMKTLTDCLGWISSDFAELNGTGKYAGTEVVVVCEEEEYEGKKYTKVKFMNPIGSVSKVKPLDTDAARSLAETLKARAMAYRQSNPVKAKPMINQPAQGMDSDQLPF